MKTITGAQTLNADGITSTPRTGRNGDITTSNLHGKYYEQAYGKKLFGGSIVGQTNTVGVATTYTGLCLSNPITSTVNLVLNKVGMCFTVAFTAAATCGIMTGFNSGTNVTHTAAGTVRNKFIGSSVTGSGLLDTSATLPTAPVLDTILLEGLTGTISTTVESQSLFDIEGSIILPPGAYACVYTSTASGTNGMSASFTWEEVPV
jgi:hypothetical protein